MVCRLVPFSVIAGVVTVPVNVGFAFGALSSNSFTTLVPSTTKGPGDILQLPTTAKSQSTLTFVPPVFFGLMRSVLIAFGCKKNHTRTALRRQSLLWYLKWSVSRCYQALSMVSSVFLSS